MIFYSEKECKLLFEQILRINDTDDFFGRDLLPWLVDEINKFILDHELSYEDIFMILVSVKDYKCVSSAK